MGSGFLISQQGQVATCPYRGLGQAQRPVRLLQTANPPSPAGRTTIKEKAGLHRDGDPASKPRQTHVREKRRVEQSIARVRDTKILRLYAVSEEEVRGVRVALVRGPEQALNIGEPAVNGARPPGGFGVELR